MEGREMGNDGISTLILKLPVVVVAEGEIYWETAATWLWSLIYTEIKKKYAAHKHCVKRKKVIGFTLLTKQEIYYIEDESE